MKITIIKNKRQKEIVTRHSLDDLATYIQKGWREADVRELRLMYHLMD